jgi:DNA-binding transcriptional ArsR family regulator
MGTNKSAADVFGLLSDDTRVEILQAVARAQSDAESMNAGPAELTFSEIYERVDVDNTSKLSYHLTELSETFLRKEKGGYSFTHTGERVSRLILSENYGDVSPFEPIDADGTCLYCGGSSLQARLYYQFFTVQCTDCGRPVSGHAISPAQARSREANELLQSVKQRQAMEYRLVRRGICPECAGTVDTEVRAIEDGPLPDADPYLAIDRCSDCLRRYGAPLSYGVAYHPASVAFHWERGEDVTTKGMWEFHDRLAERRWTAERRSTDPTEYEVVLRHGEDAFRCRLDATASVRHTERVRRS